MKISIITICRNNEKDIRPTLESVVNQTYSEIEYIVVDGASTDNTLSIVNEYKDKIAKIISEPDKGLYDAINKGIKNATGDIVGLIHAGDRLYDNEVVAKIAKHFEENNIDISYGHSIIVDTEGKIKLVHKSPKYSRWRIKIGWMPSHQSMYIRREVFDKFGYYNLDFHPYSDYELFLRFFYFNSLIIKQMDEYIVRFSLGGVSSCSKKKTLQLQKLYKNCWKHHRKNSPWYIVPIKFVRRIKMMFLAKINYK
jgi:glycosyltransferase